jgi:hypothetical protein
MFTQLKILLPKAIHQKNMARVVDAAQVCQAYRQICPLVLGEHFAHVSFPKYFRHRVLTIEAQNPSVAQELHFQKHLIIDALNQKLEQTMVMNIRIV